MCDWLYATWLGGQKRPGGAAFRRSDGSRIMEGMGRKSRHRPKHRVSFEVVSMRTTTSHPRTEQKTRFIFRVLAGVLALFLLLGGSLLAVVEALDGRIWQAWFTAVSCYFAGIGFAVGARTGRWPFTFGTPG